ncbi:MAG: serine/threonine-protein kinase, partial [Myxococcota bacterium]
MTQDPAGRLSFELGTVLDGRYRLTRLLGEGGVGFVYRGEHVAVGRPVAVKVLQRRYVDHESLRPRFEREAKALASLTHPNIVAIQDYGMSDGNPYVVMELLEGHTLREVIDEGPMDWGRALNILKQLLRALAYAHTHGLAHRDIKPGNIFLQELPRQPEMVKLLDFGFAKFLKGWDRDANENISQVGQAFGTPSYLAPEQATGADTDAHADVYATGVTLYEMLSGQKPFRGTLPEIVRQHLVAPIPSVAEARPDLEHVELIDAIVRRAMDKQPDNRFADATAMLEAVEAIPRPRSIRPPAKTNPPANTSRPANPNPPEGELERSAPGVESGAPPRTRSRMPVVVLGVIALGLGASAAWFLGTTGGEEPATADEDVEPPPDPEVPMSEPEPAEEPGEMVLSEEEVGDVVPLDADSAWELGGTMPGLVASTKTAFEAGEEIDRVTLVAVHDIAQESDHDPRANLLLGRIYFERRWMSDALRRYESAYEQNPA